VFFHHRQQQLIINQGEAGKRLRLARAQRAPKASVSRPRTRALKILSEITKK
jgi:hypothetical protein